MNLRAVLRYFSFSLLCFLPWNASIDSAFAQSAHAPAADNSPRLQFVVILSRHGVRSPIGDPHQFDRYTATQWPKWEVQPSYLTPHGYDLMKLFGVWDRAHFAGDGLFAPTGCAEAGRVTIIADSDQRTRETGKALAEGMFPNCTLEMHADSEGTSDPLFRLVGGLHGDDKALAAAAVAGRMGGDPKNLTAAFHPQLEAIDGVLAGCGHAAASDKKRESILDIPAAIGGGGENSSSYRGPVSVAATMAEDFLLEYTDGMSKSDTGWGCIDGAKLRELMQVDTANWDFNYRTPTVARFYASNLLDHIERSLEQSISGHPVAGALSQPGDRMLLIVGHDTNLVTVAGALGINWIIDGRVDDTPPGGALLFEVWRAPDGGWPFVRVEYTAQTLEQMRESQLLSPENPPAIAPVFVPGCSQQDGKCTWEGFSAAMRSAIDPEYVTKEPERSVVTISDSQAFPR
jgi:4-phytase/acid phosphatase